MWCFGAFRSRHSTDLRQNARNVRRAPAVGPTLALPTHMAQPLAASRVRHRVVGIHSSCRGASDEALLHIRTMTSGAATSARRRATSPRFEPSSIESTDPMSWSICAAKGTRRKSLTFRLVRGAIVTCWCGCSGLGQWTQLAMRRMSCSTPLGCRRAGDVDEASLARGQEDRYVNVSRGHGGSRSTATPRVKRGTRTRELAPSAVD